MDYHRTVLPNGARLITVPMPESPTVTVVVLVEAGSKYETKKISGVSHFLEHFLFKGSQKRPTPVAISHELDALGAASNAFTSQENTVYFAKARKDKAVEILDIISDLYINPILPEKELPKEKGVIIQEISMYEDDPMRHVQDVLMELFYGDQPAGWNIAGTKGSVGALTRDDLARYRESHYVASSTVVVLAGAFEERLMAGKVSVLFDKLSAAPKPEKAKVIDTQKSPAAFLRYKATDQTHIVIGARAFSTFDPDVPALRLLSVILGGGMSSRLFVKLREELGICYYIGASPDLFTDHGLFQVAAGVDTARAPLAVKTIIEELGKVKNEAVPAKELRKAKDYLIGNIYLGLESTDERALFYGGQEVAGKPIKTPAQVTAEIEAVTSSDIERVARRLFVARHINLAMVGPLKEGTEFLPLLKL